MNLNTVLFIPFHPREEQLQDRYVCRLWGWELLTDNSLRKTPFVFILNMMDFSYTAQGKGPPASSWDSCGFTSQDNLNSLLIMLTLQLLKTKSKLTPMTIIFYVLYVHVFSLQERLSFKFTSSSNSLSLLKLPMKAGDNQCQISEQMSKCSNEVALQFAWPTIWVHLVWHSRWKCSHLRLAPSVLQLYNPPRRSVLEHIFFKAKHPILPSKTFMFSSRNRPFYLPIRVGVS